MNRTTTDLAPSSEARKALRRLTVRERDIVRQRKPRVESVTVTVDKEPVSCTCREAPHKTSVVAHWVESEITGDGAYKAKLHREQLCLAALEQLITTELKVSES